MSKAPPISVQKCESGDWTILVWKKSAPEQATAHQFVCKSWRHTGPCQSACGACDFARIKEGLRKHRHWCYAVLTYPHGDWPDPDKLFRFGVTSWGRLQKRLIREFGKLVYVQTWEAHASGYPHVNLAVSNAALWEKVGPAPAKQRRAWFKAAAVACGFGWRVEISQLRDRGAVAGYLTKLGLELSGAGEKNQIPVEAPPHFRRIRASRGLLPARYKDETITGMLLKSRADRVAAGLGVDLDLGGRKK